MKLGNITQKTIGQKLVEDGILTESQVEKAIERQKLYGGRLGANLISLGFLKSEELDSFFKKYPAMPKNVDDTGLDLPFITDLVMKHVLFMGEFTLGDVSESTKLPVSIVDSAMQVLRREKFVEVKGAAEYARVSYKFGITSQGRNRGLELLDICQYIGPAPVTLEQYKEMIDHQTIKNIVVSEDSVKNAFKHLVISDSLLKRLGPAISSGKAIFIYGPPGNGKTTIAETIGKILPGTVFMPHAIIVGGQIIKVFDSVNHITAQFDRSIDNVDRRWICVKRPVIMTGGELTLRMLDLDFNPISKFYESSLQIKANNGLFLVDDFGRQQIGPHEILNRWIVPLERRTDFMTLHTGMKFDIPFDTLVIFATNIDPKRLVDEAFLRRIRYKVQIDHPTEKEYKQIFVKVCESNSIEFKTDVYDYLMTNYYKKLDIKLNACHPRDIIDHVIDDAHYYNHRPMLTTDIIDMAWANYFVEL